MYVCITVFSPDYYCTVRICTVYVRVYYSVLARLLLYCTYLYSICTCVLQCSRQIIIVLYVFVQYMYVCITVFSPDYYCTVRICTVYVRVYYSVLARLLLYCTYLYSICTYVLQCSRQNFEIGRCMWVKSKALVSNPAPILRKSHYCAINCRVRTCMCITVW